MKERKINVLVVDDSAVVREFMVHLLSSDPEIQVIATARNGEEAINAVTAKKPDVITMDMNMPVINGFEATRAIMETNPTPIIIVSGSNEPDEVALTFRAIGSGALTAVSRPPGVDHPEFEKSANHLTQLIKCMAEVKVVRRWPEGRRAERLPFSSTPGDLRANPRAGEIRIVAMGASTGGPNVLQTILSNVNGCPIPIVVVQHIATGFVEGFAQWLEQTTGFPVKVAVQGERLSPGQAYLAPDDYHMEVKETLHVSLTKDEHDQGLRPSISHLFRSVAGSLGPKAIGILLTGMGRDGAHGLKALRDAGGHTIAQDEATSVIFGMPKEAIAIGAVDEVLPTARIAERLQVLVRQPQKEMPNWRSQ